METRTASIFFIVLFFAFSVAGTVIFFGMPAHARGYIGAIATAQHVTGGTPVPGDVVSFNPKTETFYLAHTVGDKYVAGVVVSNPTLLLSDSTGGTPIVTTGQVSMNVSTRNGPIHVADMLTTSSIPGVAERASSTTPYILGTALTSFPDTLQNATNTNAANTVATGTIDVLLSIGVSPASVANNSSSTPLTAMTQDKGIGNKNFFLFVKYVLAALITAGTIYVAFRTSKSAMNSSIISIGRNPLAKRSIRSMLIADTAIIVLISVIGLAMAVALIFVPL